MKQQTSANTENVSKTRTMVDFTGKTVYVGIDVHKKDWQVCLFYSGISLGNHRMGADIPELIAFFHKNYPGAILKCVYESCAWGFTLQRELTTAGIDCIVVHAGDIPGSDKEKKNKTDKVDAARLARHHAAGLLTAIYVPDDELQKERNLIRFRKKILGDLTRSKNRLKSLLKFQGINIPVHMDNPNWSKNFIDWIEQQAAQDALLQDTVSLMLEEVKLHRQLLLKTERRVRELMRSDKYATKAKLLMSIPGIGGVTSTLFLLEVGNVQRFRGFDQLNNFIGFYPGSNSSGESSNTGRQRVLLEHPERGPVQFFLKHVGYGWILDCLEYIDTLRRDTEPHRGLYYQGTGSFGSRGSHVFLGRTEIA